MYISQRLYVRTETLAFLSFIPNCKSPLPLQGREEVKRHNMISKPAISYLSYVFTWFTTVLRRHYSYLFSNLGSKILLYLAVLC